MWGFFLKIKRYMFGKSHPTSISERIIENRTSILGSYGNVGQQGLHVPYAPLSKQDKSITSTELANYFVKDGLDIPGQISTYFSEKGMGASSKVKVDVGSLLGLNISTPSNFPIKAKVGLEAEVSANIALSGAKGTLLFIEYQPDIAEYKKNKDKEFTPICFGAMTGGKANVNVGISASAGLVAKSSISVEPFEALELSAFSAKAQALSVEAKTEYSGTCFRYSTQNLKMYSREQDDLYDSVAKDISDIVDKKGKISNTKNLVSHAKIPIDRESYFSGWLQTGSASIKGSVLSLDVSQGGFKSGLEGWYKVCASLLNNSVDVLSKSWDKQIKRLFYTFETPARGWAKIRHQVTLSYTMTQSSLAVCALQINAGNIKTELFGEKNDDSKNQEIARSSASFYTKKLISKTEEKANNVSPVFYSNKKVKQKIAINNAMTYTDMVTYLDKDEKAKSGSGLIYGQSINLNTLKRFIELRDNYTLINFLKKDYDSFENAMTIPESDIPQCTDDALTAMKQAILDCLGESTNLISTEDFKKETNEKLRRVSIESADIALQTFHSQYSNLKKELSKLISTQLTDCQLIEWGIKIDLLFGLLGTIEDNLILWALEKGEQATRHARTHGVGLLLDKIDQEKRRIYSHCSNILLFKELCQLRNILDRLSDVLHIESSTIITFLCHNAELINDLTQDTGVKPEAVLIEAAHAYSLNEDTIDSSNEGHIESLRLRYRIADREKTETTLFKLGFSICDAVNASISLQYFDQYKSEGIVNLSTYWFGDKEKFNTRLDIPKYFIPPAVLITE